MIIQEEDYLMHDAFLKHFGVPGMKWGIRKNRNVIKARNAMLRAKTAKKIASKNAWDTYSQAYDYSSAHPFTLTKRSKKESTELWNRFDKDNDKEVNAMRTYNNAKKAYKEAKKIAKTEYKAKYKKALADNKAALKKNKEKYLSTGDKSDKIFDSAYKKAYNSAIKSGASKSTAEQAGADAAMKRAGAYEKKVKDEYKKTKKKLKEDRYHIRYIGV